MTGETAVQGLAPAPAEEDRARAELYALLAAMLARAPDEAMLGRLRQLPPPDEADDSMLAAAWAMLKQEAERAELARLREEYQDLFIGLGRGELVPYGSWYLTGFLMEQPLAELRADLRRLGFERQDEVHEPEDHVAALCETMSLLIDDGAALETQRAFFGKHLGPWIARFFADMATAPSARFYRAVALLGERFIEVERAGLEMPA
jgi:TorA maturation chaperone TorD